jgi:hypothetical protein
MKVFVQWKWPGPQANPITLHSLGQLAVKMARALPDGRKDLLVHKFEHLTVILYRTSITPSYSITLGYIMLHWTSVINSLYYIQYSSVYTRRCVSTDILYLANWSFWPYVELACNIIHREKLVK